MSLHNTNDHPRIHISIPESRRNQPANSTSTTFRVAPPAYGEYYDTAAVGDAWGRPQLASPETPRPRVHSLTELSARQAGQNTVGIGHIAFPEPQFYRSTSDGPSSPHRRSLEHQRSRDGLDSLSSPGLYRAASTTSLISTVSSYNQADESDPYGLGSGEYSRDSEDFSRELSNLSLESEEDLRRFQAGQLLETDQAWHRLVPPEARDALGGQEVQRQSVLFEVFKAEREYVSDLETVEEVFIKGLQEASPPIISASRLPLFLGEVFGNLGQILTHHQHMLGALFERQRDQHPLVQSVADIILDTVLKSEFRSAYESYIKHYPLAESYHRKELKRNPAYEAFVHSVSMDPRIRKRDLITFLSRPVTRLPRLNLLLEQILKVTDDFGHPDLESLPIILSILSDCIKSTQPGIEAAESKVKFWALCESLVFRKGEIIDMDLYDESRTLVYSSPIFRLVRTDSGRSGWSELTGALLDNFFVITRDEKRSNGTVKRHIMSRPLPLSYLRLGSFTSPVESRKEKAEDGSILDSFRSQAIPVYPFTIYHASSRSTRRYTLYVASESIRKRWYSAFIDAIGVHKARQDANMWFYQQTLTDDFFRIAASNVRNNSTLTGRVTAAVPFSTNGRRFLAVGCLLGIYVSPKGLDEYRRVFNYSSPNTLAALQSIGSKVFNKFIIHSDTSLVAYPLDVVVQAALNKDRPNPLPPLLEHVADPDLSVVFFKHVHVGERVLIIYGFKRRLHVSMNLQAVEVVHAPSVVLTPQRTPKSPSVRSFRPFGGPGYVPRDASDISPLSKTVGICVKDGIIIVDPTNLARSTPVVVPDLSDAATNFPVNALKTRLEDAKPLGLVRVSPTELLIIYDLVGCYITKRGTPSRSSGYIKWETKAKSFAHRGGHVLLFSMEFIEIRNINTGRIVQVIQGSDIRLLYSGPTYEGQDSILVAMKGSKDDEGGTSEKIVELVETSEITVATPVTAVPSVWDEWDM